MNEVLLFVIGTLVFTITVWGFLIAGIKTRNLDKVLSLLRG